MTHPQLLAQAAAVLPAERHHVKTRPAAMRCLMNFTELIAAAKNPLKRFVYDVMNILAYLQT